LRKFHSEIYKSYIFGIQNLPEITQPKVNKTKLNTDGLLISGLNNATKMLQQKLNKGALVKKVEKTHSEVLTGI